MPDQEELIRRGVNPTLVLHVIDDPVTPTDAADVMKQAEDQLAWVDAMARVAVRELSEDGKKWETVSLTEDHYARLAPSDRGALRAIILSERTPAMVTAYTRYQAGEITAEDVEEIMAVEAPKLTESWVPFRTLLRRAIARSNGEDLGSPAQLPNRRTRRAARTRAR